MKESTKIIVLLLMFAVLLTMLYQSAMDGKCMSYGADGARITASGIFCWRDEVNLFRVYYRLSELKAKHEGKAPSRIIFPTPIWDGL